MTRGGGLLEAAAAASRLLRGSDGHVRRLLPLRRALTADAAASVQQEQQQQHRPLPSPSSNAAAADDDEFASAHARRLREMEASTSMQRATRLETAAQVSARLRSEQRSGGKASIRSSFSPPSSSSSSSLLPSPDDSSEKSDRSAPPALRDWRDALEAAKMLEPGGDPLTDSFG